MSRFVKTVAAADGSGGGGGSDAGLTAAQACQYACKAVCDMFCTNLICPECRPYYNTLPTPTVDDWVVVCHCDCWTNCYGQNVVWCLDTNKYKGFKWCYRGVRIKGCCWWYGQMGMAAKGVDCFCCCTNTYRNACKCHFPLTQCCSACWSFYEQCMIEIGCQQCCSSQCDGLFNFGWAVFPQWQKALSNQSRVYGQVGYCIWMPKGNRDSVQCAGGSEVYMGTNSHCISKIVWNEAQACKGTTCYLDRWCLCVNGGHAFSSAISNGCWEQNTHNGTDCDGNQLPSGVTPSWTMWAIPCCYPMNIGSYSGGTGLTCYSSFPNFDENPDWVQPSS